MTLRDLKTYLSAHRRATLNDLANHFRCDPHTLQAMLTHWERKGNVRHTHLAAACSKGCCAGQMGMDIYEWVDALPADTTPPNARGGD